MDRIKRLSLEVLDKHKSKFGENFDDNKKSLDSISIIRSKGLKNEIAGYITKIIKKQVREQNAKEERIKSMEDDIPEEQTESKSTETPETDVPIETSVDTAEIPVIETPEIDVPVESTNDSQEKSE